LRKYRKENNSNWLYDTIELGKSPPKLEMTTQPQVRRLHMKKNLRFLPEGFQTVAGIIGYEKAVELSKHFGGTTIYIPTHKTTTRHKRNESIKKDHRSGCSYGQLSQKYGLSQVAIRNIISCDS
jgi:hypothetical protein